MQTPVAPKQSARDTLAERLGCDEGVEELLREGERLEEAAAAAGGVELDLFLDSTSRKPRRTCDFSAGTRSASRAMRSPQARLEEEEDMRAML